MTDRLLPAGAHEDHIDTDRGRLRLLRSGSAVRAPDVTPLVLIHGGGYDNSAISWFHLFAAFGPGREVIAVDLPGFGASIDLPPVGGPVPMAELIAEVITRLDLGPAVVLGCSMGGDVALHLALAHPDLVAGLGLIGPGGLTPMLRGRPTHTMAWAATKIPDQLLLASTRLANRFVDAAIKGFVHDRDAIDDRVLAEFRAEAAHPRAGIAYGRYNQATIGRRGMTNDVTGRVSEISVPVLIVHGEQDVMVDPSGSRRAAARMPDAQLVLVPDCGHWAQLERPGIFKEELSRLLARVDGGR